MIKKILRTLSFPLKKILFLRIQNIKIKKSQKKVHIVRSDTIGDFVLFTAVLPYFKKLYSEHKIILIGDDIWQELALWIRKYRVLGNKSNYFDELIPINGKFYNRSPFYYYKILKKLRLSAPEIVLQPTFSRTQKSDDWVLISKEAQKIGYKGDLSNIKPAQKKRNDKKYDRLIQNPDFSLETDKNKHFLNEIAGYELVPSSLPQWKLTEKLLSEGRNFLKSFGINSSGRILTVFPSGSAGIRCWPIEKFVSLILKLFRCKPSLQFVLIGGSQDKKICLEIEKDKKMKNLPIYNLCGKTKLSELAKILALTNLYIGNDTGAMHMASAVGTSTICLLGGGHYCRFFPYPAWKKGAKNIAIIHKMDCFNCNWRCKYKIKKGNPAPCLKGIKVEEVYNQVIKFLNNLF